MVRQYIKSGLKKVRAWQPFSWVATSMVRAGMRAVGVQSELVIKHLHRVGGVSSRLPNGCKLRLWSRGDDWICNEVYWRGWQGFEPESSPLFFRLATAARVTLDVGAHVGFYSILAAHANPAGRVYAFEPLPSVYERLKKNVALNGLENVECIHSAASDTSGEAPFFHVASAEYPSSSSLSYAFMSQAGYVTCSTMVPVVRLDDFAQSRELGPVDLVKVDTESTEPDVLRGMEQVLRRDKPDILCEVLVGVGTEGPLEALLRPLGYRYYMLTSAGPQEQHEIRAHSSWRNYMFSTREPQELQSVRVKG
jgi:FkbM family methyltransferase